MIYNVRGMDINFKTLSTESKLPRCKLQLISKKNFLFNSLSLSDIVLNCGHSDSLTDCPISLSLSLWPILVVDSVQLHNTFQSRFQSLIANTRRRRILFTKVNTSFASSFFPRNLEPNSVQGCFSSGIADS